VNADQQLHIFKTYLGLPPAKGEAPVCGAVLTDAYDFPGVERPKCPECQKALEVADQLDSWADDIEGADIPECPEPEEQEIWIVVNTHDDTPVFDDQPEGWDTVEGATAAMLDYVKQSGEDLDNFSVRTDSFTPEDPTEEQLDEWRSEVESAVSVIDECPV
jgi:hypothetical protein